MVLHARVKNGRYVIDEPADLPEGAVLELVPVDDMDEEESAALEASIAEGLAAADAGKTTDADEVLRRLRAKP
jgi:predicted transcriptional regulator